MNETLAPKNIVHCIIHANGNVHIGDTGSSSGDNYEEKNAVKGSNIKAGGDFHLGDVINTK